MQRSKKQQLRRAKGMKPEDSKKEPRHCDSYINSFDAPNALKWFLFFNRLPAMDKGLCRDNGIDDPKLWAQYEDKWIRVVMASRMGDVGITSNLDADHGYDSRVSVEDLTGFTDERPKFNKF
jgi:hypothetical protein